MDGFLFFFSIYANQFKCIKSQQRFRCECRSQGEYVHVRVHMCRFIWFFVWENMYMYEYICVGLFDSLFCGLWRALKMNGQFVWFLLFSIVKTNQPTNNNSNNNKKHSHSITYFCFFYRDLPIHRYNLFVYSCYCFTLKRLVM